MTADEGRSADELLCELVRLSGLSSLLAPGVLRRALADVGASDPPTPADFLRALPKLEGRMRAYLTEDEVRERTFRIRKLLGAE